MQTTLLKRMEIKLAGFLNDPQMVSMLEVVVAHPLDDPSNVMVLDIPLMERSPIVVEMGYALRIQDSMVEVANIVV